MPVNPSATWNARERGATPAAASTGSPSTAWSWPRSPLGGVSWREASLWIPAQPCHGGNSRGAGGVILAFLSLVAAP